MVLWYVRACGSTVELYCCWVVGTYVCVYIWEGGREGRTLRATHILFLNPCIYMLAVYTHTTEDAASNWSGVVGVVYPFTAGSVSHMRGFVCLQCVAVRVSSCGRYRKEEWQQSGRNTQLRLSSEREGEGDTSYGMCSIVMSTNTGNLNKRFECLCKTRP